MKSTLRLALGLFKEIIVDRSFDGEVRLKIILTIYLTHDFFSFPKMCVQPIPENVFIVAAC